MSDMRIIRYKQKGQIHIAVVNGEEIKTAPHPTVTELLEEAKRSGLQTSVWINSQLNNWPVAAKKLDELQLQVPFELSEVWAAGVTYQRSREARNYEATGGVLNAETFYDKVYDADRPELFLKSTPSRTVGPGQAVAIRSDSNWQIPEPELGLVLNKEGELIGYTIGNDMSCRDIEGENPLYLPQAKVWKRSCAIGPALTLADTIDDVYNLSIRCRIIRNKVAVFEDAASLKQLKRTVDELISYLLRDNEIDDYTVLLTGTCIVPPNDFTLKEQDEIEIEVEGIGKLSNVVNSTITKKKEMYT